MGGILVIDPPAGAPTPDAETTAAVDGVEPVSLVPDSPVPAQADAVGGFSGDIVDEWGRQSFPASDPPANW